MDIQNLTALELGSKIKQGELSSLEATKAILQNIKFHNGNTNSYITVAEEYALSRAAEVDVQLRKGLLSESPLAGVPIAIKDNICTKGIKTTCASKMLQDFVPPYDATAVSRLNNAGMIIVGKLNMDEFAMGSASQASHYGPVSNPLNHNKVPGGSSGGAAAAVATGTSLLSLASDTGGSIRQPASHCGVTGYKPTYGLVSRYGLIAHASSLDQIGPIAKTAADCAACADIIIGQDSFDNTTISSSEFPSAGHLSSTENLSQSLQGKKICLPTEYFTGNLNKEVCQAVLSAAAVFKELGATVEESNLPLYTDYAIPAYYVIACAEASSNLARYDGVRYGFRTSEVTSLSELYENSRSEAFGAEVKKRILLGTFVLSSGYYDSYYKKAIAAKSIIAKSFSDLFNKYDLVLSPTAPTTAPLKTSIRKDPLTTYLSDVYTVSANLSGLPAISFPCGIDSENMPIGAQLIAPHLGDSLLLRAAHAFQLATNFHTISHGGDL